MKKTIVRGKFDVSGAAAKGTEKSLETGRSGDPPLDLDSELTRLRCRQEDPRSDPAIIGRLA